MDFSGPNTSPLWVYRVCNYNNAESEKSADESLKEWKIHKHIRSVVKAKGITKLFPVQEKIIPLLLNNEYRDRYSPLSCDFVITAPTGQGKTLCYLLPLINNLTSLKRNGMSLLIIAPTRELVKQIHEICTWFTVDDPAIYGMYGGELLRTIACYGNKSFEEDHEVLVNSPPHIAVFTPGRFVDHLDPLGTTCGEIKVDTVKWIVMDEVDLLLSQTLYNWTGLVHDLFGKERETYSLQSGLAQKILVSATIPSKSSEIDLLKLNRPLLFKSDDAIYKLPKGLKQYYISTSKRGRPILIVKLLCSLYKRDKGEMNTLVFCSKKTTTHRVARMLQICFKRLNHSGSLPRVLEFSASFSQRLRNDILDTYRNESGVCLVCSDVASRGVDLSRTLVVVNYDFPKKLATYIHRVGRTARGVGSGESYIFVSKKDEGRFSSFVAKLNVAEGIEEGQLVDEELDARIRSIHPNVVEMVEKCLGLENEGRIPFNASIDDHMNELL